MLSARIGNTLTKLLPRRHAAALPAPRTPRELLTALASHEEHRGLDAFLDQFDFDGVTPHQVFYSVLARPPESAQAARMLPGYDARQHLQQALLSPEFQRNLIAYVLHAFPEKKRVFFIHVPKCAGTDLASHLMQRYVDGYLEQKLQGPAYTPPLQALGYLQRLLVQLPRRKDIVVMGHFPLDSFVSRQLIRFGDASFTVIRDPIGMALSVVNYALTLMELQPQDRPLVAMGFIKAINLRTDTQGLPTDPEDRKRFALQLLRDPKVLPKNFLCQFLGHGDAASAIDLCAAANIEITTVSRYEAWLQQRWGVENSAHANASRTYLRLADLSDDDLAYLHDITQEDQRFYALVDTQLAASGQHSLFGASLCVSTSIPPAIP